ncbi:hypothetical protein OU800_07090 [Pseudomonas sp. GOM7]|uniref:hypothetical protein n=1 Tax=Pseudomonas sp. GOM7 TaxID=2998079 RepID=UPI00227C04CA|nr:hypothetical protein [Pseudomonas sp. GOM7]WAJ38984.1 hypothetical protein OU800_07090 [Pseudomonas sp. GOM7]
MSRILTANLFIDWDSASRITNESKLKNNDLPLPIIEREINNTYSMLRERVIEKTQELIGNDRLKITKTRLYHGWHMGTTATRHRIAWENLKPSFRTIIRGSISYLPDIEFGNELLCKGNRVPIYNTLRERERKPARKQDPKEYQQKMVDTALVADLLSYSRTESRNFRRDEKPASMAIVIGDDDDLLPGAFVAEAWGLPIYVYRISRSFDSKHINTDGMIHRI